MCNALADSAALTHDSPTANTLATSFSDACTRVLDEQSPLKQVTISARQKPKPQPWVNDRLRNLFHKRKHLHMKVLKRPHDESVKQQYRTTRREGTLLNRKLRREYYNRQFRIVKDKPRQQWALLNTLTGRNIIHEQPQASLEDLSSTFQSIVTDPNRSTSLDTQMTGTPTIGGADTLSFHAFRPVSVLEVKDNVFCFNMSC